MNAIKTNSELFLDLISDNVFSDKQKEAIRHDIECYDRKWFDELNRYMILSVTKSGYINCYVPSEYSFDPWKAKHALDKKNIFVEFNPDADYVFSIVDYEYAQANLYEGARSAYYKKNVAPLNNVVGRIVSFNELLGSIPEHMRDIIEAGVVDEKQWYGKSYPIKDKLFEFYNYQLSNLVNYMSKTDKVVKVKDENGEEKYVHVPITKIGVYFNRFDYYEGSSQAQAYFAVHDESPAFNPEPHYNWHLIEDSRVISNGVIVLSLRIIDDKETVEVSIHT